MHKAGKWLLALVIVGAGMLVNIPAVWAAKVNEQINVTARVSDLRPLGAPELEVSTSGSRADFTSSFTHLESYVIYICKAEVLGSDDCTSATAQGLVAQLTGSFAFNDPDFIQDVINGLNLGDGDYIAQIVVKDYWGRSATSGKRAFTIRTQVPDFTAVSESSFDGASQCSLSARLYGTFQLPSCFNIAMENLGSGTTTLIQRCFTTGSSWSTVIGLGVAGSYRFRVQAVDPSTQTTSEWSAWKTLIVHNCTEPEKPPSPPPDPPTVDGPTIGGSTGGFVCVEIFISKYGEGGESEYGGYRLLKCFCASEIANDSWSLNYELPDGEYEVVIRGVTESGVPLSEWSGETKFEGSGGSLSAAAGLTAPGFSLLAWLASLSQTGYKYLEMGIMVLGAGAVIGLWWLLWYRAHMVTVIDYEEWKKDKKSKKVRAEGAMVRFIDATGKVVYQRITNKKGRVHARLNKGDYVGMVNWRFYRLMETKDLDVADREGKKFLAADTTLSLKHTKSLTYYLPMATAPLTDNE